MRNSKRAIYADDLLSAIRDDTSINGANFARVKRHINEAPTVDATPVVLCKECKYCSVCYPEKQISKEATQGWFCKGLKRYRKPDDFCSFGERREGE